MQRPLGDRNQAQPDAKSGKGFHLACEDIDPILRLVVYPGADRFPLKHDVEAVPLHILAKTLVQLG